MFSSKDPGWAWRQHINLSQRRGSVGGQVRKEKAQTYPGRAARSHHPRLGQSKARGPPPCGHCPGSGLRGQRSPALREPAPPAAVQMRERESPARCCCGSLSGLSPLVVTQFPKYSWNRCPSTAGWCSGKPGTSHQHYSPASCCQNLTALHPLYHPPHLNKTERNSLEVVCVEIQPWTTNKYWWLETELEVQKKFKDVGSSFNQQVPGSLTFCMDHSSSLSRQSSVPHPQVGPPGPPTLNSETGPLIALRLLCFIPMVLATF